MRAARLLKLTVGTTATLITLSVASGCALSSNGTNVSGANPGSGNGSGGKTVAAVAVVASTSIVRTGTPNAESGATANAATPTSTDTSVGTDTAAASSTAAFASASANVVACTAADLNLQVFESSQANRPPNHNDAPIVPIGTGLGALLHGTRTQQLTLVFTNVSNSACTTRGYPSVDFLRAGVHGPLSAPDSYSGAAKVTNVRLAPGGAARSLITFTANSDANSRGSHCDAVIAVRVYPPDSTKALISGARDEQDHPISHFYVCGHKVVVQALQAR